MKYLFLALMALSVSVFAGGDKNRIENPILTEGTCVIVIPEGIDTNQCEATPASDQSGIKTLFCEVAVVCVD